MNVLFRLMAVLALAAPLAVSAAAPRLGAVAPAFHATLLDGGEFDLAAHRGEVVILHFWASWCAPCQVEMPALEAFRAAHAGEGLSIVAVSMDDAEARAQVAAHRQHFGFGLAMAAQVHAEGYGRIWRLPISFVIDRQGRLRADGGSGAEKVYDLPALEREVGPLLREPR